jgi:hypothetical protein
MRRREEERGRKRRNLVAGVDMEMLMNVFPRRSSVFYFRTMESYHRNTEHSTGEQGGRVIEKEAGRRGGEGLRAMIVGWKVSGEEEASVPQEEHFNFSTPEARFFLEVESSSWCVPQWTQDLCSLSENGDRRSGQGRQEERGEREG